MTTNVVLIGNSTFTVRVTITERQRKRFSSLVPEIVSMSGRAVTRFLSISMSNNKRRKYIIDMLSYEGTLFVHVDDEFAMEFYRCVGITEPIVEYSTENFDDRCFMSSPTIVFSTDITVLVPSNIVGTFDCTSNGYITHIIPFIFKTVSHTYVKRINERHDIPNSRSNCITDMFKTCMCLCQK